MLALYELTLVWHTLQCFTSILFLVPNTCRDVIKSRVYVSVTEF